MDPTLARLQAIVGAASVSDNAEERYLYARDQGLQAPHAPDYVVLPGSTQEVRQIVELANEKGIPVVPMGGGMVLSGLTIPLRGGIVLDMKRMNRILEVNACSRYAVVEAGCAQGMLKAYLNKHHPTLKHSLPDAPPGVTIAGNIAIHGSGHLSQHEGGFHSEMVTGLEVVLPTGEIVRLGSCSTVPTWHARAPLPDLVGLFLGWNGTTGVITKVGLKLFPRPPLVDGLLFMSADPDRVPEIVSRITALEVAEDINFMVTPLPKMFAGVEITMIGLGANTPEEMALKKRLCREALRTYWESKEAGFVPLPPKIREGIAEAPNKTLTRFADVLKGGGYEYVGGIIPLEKWPQACRMGLEIARPDGITYSLGGRVIGRGHSVMFFCAYPFNRADEKSMERARRALHDTNVAILELGGIPWKAELPAQRLILERMEPATKTLMRRIMQTLDPAGIMNPGNWEVA